MLFLLSPAKSLDFSPLTLAVTPTLPAYLAEASLLIKNLRPYTPARLAKLMDLSDKLASLNVARYAEWEVAKHSTSGKPAVLAFNGDVYDGLEALTLPPEAVAYLQEHLLILSGLYGLLRPLDLILPHRLEMGTRLKNPRGTTLYAYWQELVQCHLATLDVELIVNLASVEYFGVVSRKKLNTRVIDCVFEEEKQGQFRIISFFAKRARGLMMAYAARHQIDQVEGLKQFDSAGYAFNATRSSAAQWVFSRRSA